jgi:hypothetical protein
MNGKGLTKEKQKINYITKLQVSKNMKSYKGSKKSYQNK